MKINKTDKRNILKVVSAFLRKDNFFSFITLAGTYKHNLKKFENFIAEESEIKFFIKNETGKGLKECVLTYGQFIEGLKMLKIQKTNIFHLLTSGRGSSFSGFILMQFALYKKIIWESDQFPLHLS